MQVFKKKQKYTIVEQILLHIHETKLVPLQERILTELLKLKTSPSYTISHFISLVRDLASLAKSNSS